ncbi:MAG: hypothetical protein J0I41_09590 [Filimonas sp.]|nr:hypothetical protein [Filimonas sp.]
MISYNPKKWLVYIVRFPKADTFRKILPLLIFMCIYSYAITYLEINYWKLSQNSNLKNVLLMHNLLGFAISMLLVFRTNTAYDRWWEGRKLWGSLVNNSRNLAIKLNAFLPNDDDKTRTFFKTLIPRFAQELQAHLQNEATRLELDDKPHPEIPNFDTSKHVPAQVATLMMNKINWLYKQGQITGDQLIILNGEIQSFMDVCGACERIKNTPIPFSYSVFIKKFTFIYILTLPVGLCFSLGYLTVPVVAIILYVLGSLEIIAEGIEDPFGRDENDLPMDRMAANIKKNIAEILA